MSCLSVAPGSSVLSSGRSWRRLMRRISTSNSALSQTEMPLAAISARVSAFMKAPPPVASTCGPLSSRPGDHARLAGAEIGLAVGSRRCRGSSCRRPFRSRHRHRRTGCRAAAPRAGRSTTCPPPSCRPARPSAAERRDDSGLRVAAPARSCVTPCAMAAECSCRCPPTAARWPSRIDGSCFKSITCSQAPVAQIAGQPFIIQSRITTLDGPLSRPPERGRSFSILSMP